MTTIAIRQYYCSFCEKIASIGRGFMRVMEIASNSRAAAELTRQGYHTEAKALMTEKLKLQGRV